MRDVAILLIVAYGLVRTVREPVIGILLWFNFGSMADTFTALPTWRTSNSTSPALRMSSSPDMAPV